MSEISSSNQSLTKILDKLGINSSKEKFAPKETKDQLGQEDFLKLMTTQLQNQDPFAPVDNADFIAQMAQFSTVTGITSMDQTMKSVSEQLSEMRIASTTQLMGHSVLVPGKFARPDKDGVISGVVDLPDVAISRSMSIARLKKSTSFSPDSIFKYTIIASMFILLVPSIGIV